MVWKVFNENREVNCHCTQDVYRAALSFFRADGGKAVTTEDGKGKTSRRSGLPVKSIILARVAVDWCENLAIPGDILDVDFVPFKIQVIGDGEDEI